MAHGLKRVSYATCDPGCKQFCFLARQPGGHINKQYCHLFVTKTFEQVNVEFSFVYFSQLTAKFSPSPIITIMHYKSGVKFDRLLTLVAAACAIKRHAVHLTNELRFSRRCQWKWMFASFSHTHIYKIV